MAFINTVDSNEARGAVAELYRTQQNASGMVPNYARIYCHNPDVMTAWTDLLKAIKSGLNEREFLLVSFTAAWSMGNTYCLLAFARRLLRQGLSAEALVEIVQGNVGNYLTDREREIVDFSSKVVLDSSRVSRADVQRLRSLGVEESEIFHIAAAAAARCFFARLGDGLGVQADAHLADMDATLVSVLSVGRPIEGPGTQ